MKKKFFVYADESGIETGSPCYSIGALAIAEEDVENLYRYIKSIVSSYKINYQGELKWKKIEKNVGMINLGLLLLDWLLRRHMVFYSCIVVNKQLYRLWSEPSPNREEAFYKTYTFLIEHLAGTIASYLGEELELAFKVFIDDRSDKYDKRDEVMEKIANYMLKPKAENAEITEVKKENSQKVLGIQIVDLFTGAINTGHKLFLAPNMRINKGKAVFIERMASMLGWDRLHYDTFPNANFNIWHFPIEWRGIPETKQVKYTTSKLSLVSKDDLI